jgi:hypothetical protein
MMAAAGERGGEGLVHRSGRDLCLGIAAAFLGLERVLTAAGLLVDAYPIGLLAPWTISSSGALALAGHFVQAAGLVVLSVALLGGIERRGGRFKAGAYILAAGYAASLATHVIFAVRLLSLEVAPFSGRGFSVGLVVALAAGLWAMVSAVVVAPLATAGASRGRTAEDGPEGWRLLSVVVGFAVIEGIALVNQIVTGYRVWLTVDGGVMNGGWAGGAFLFAATAIASIAFVTAARARTESALDSLHRRETLLILAAALLLVFALWAVKPPSIVAPAPGVAYAAAVVAVLVGTVLSRRSLPPQNEGAGSLHAPGDGAWPD